MGVRKLLDVKVGDPVLVVTGQAAVHWEVESIDETTVTVGAMRYDKLTGYAQRRIEGQRKRLRTPEEHGLDLGAEELGRYLAALHLLIEDGADLDELAEQLAPADLRAACDTSRKLCELLGVQP